jgi:hypothetical protein
MSRARVSGGRCAAAAAAVAGKIDEVVSPLTPTLLHIHLSPSSSFYRFHRIASSAQPRQGLFGSWRLNPQGEANQGGIQWKNSVIENIF